MKRFFFLCLLLLLVRLPANATIFVSQKSSTTFKVLTLDSKRVSTTPTTETQDLVLKNSQGAWYWIKVTKVGRGPNGSSLSDGFILKPNGVAKMGRVKWSHGESIALVADGSTNSSAVKLSLTMDALWRLAFDAPLPDSISEQLSEINKEILLKTAGSEALSLLSDCNEFIKAANKGDIYNAAKSIGQVATNKLLGEIIKKEFSVKNPKLVAKFQAFTAPIGDPFFLAKAGRVIALEITTLIAPHVDVLTLDAAFSGPKPKITVSNSNVLEGNSGQVIQRFRVSLSAPWWQTIRAGYSTVEGTAKKSQDYLTGVGALVFAPDAPLTQYIEVPVLGDTLSEGDETYGLRVGTSGFTSINSPATGTIRDDDVFTGGFSINDVSAIERNSGQKIARFTVSLSQPALRDISLSYSTKDGTAKTPGDYIATAGTLLFKAKQTAATIAVPVVGDTLVESDETFFVKISAAGSKFTKSTGIATIVDDDKVTPPSASGKIVFSSAYDGNSDIYVMNADGSNQTRLTNAPSYEFSPCFSPDGSKISFVSDRGTYELYVMNADGTNQTRLGNSNSNLYPCFSPDGTKIVFSSYLNNHNSEIYVVNTDGTNQTRLTNSNNSDHDPCFSPDGSKIVFFSYRDGYGAFYVMNADGTNQTRLTNNNNDNNNSYKYSPCFSQDGSKISFVSRGETYDYSYGDIYVMNADGTNQTRLTNSNDKDFNFHPCFSPDGTKITFVSDRDGNYEIYVVNTDGTNQTRLTNSNNSDSYPCFSPDGSKIVFVSHDDSYDDSYDDDYDYSYGNIYVMNADGTNQTRLTNNSSDADPSWARGSVPAPKSAAAAPKLPSAPSS